MDKRYQVFVSSTYADLREERQRVIQTIMEMDCIPAGMELFPAVDEEQWKFIQRIIDDCDYYVLVIGGRYGTMTPEGISYTEKEYTYALEKSLPVLAFVHENPDDIALGRSEVDPDMRSRLDAFRDRVATGRLVRFWRSASDLPGLVALSLSKTIKTHPAVGWVRANQIASATVLSELNELRKRNADLERKLSEMLTVNASPTVSNIASLEDKVTMAGRYSSGNQFDHWQYETTWAEIFALIAPHLLQFSDDYYVRRQLAQSLFAKTGLIGAGATITDQLFQTAQIQLMALRLVDVNRHVNSVVWTLTPRGKEALVQLRAVRRDGAKEGSNVSGA